MQSRTTTSVIGQPSQEHTQQPAEEQPQQPPQPQVPQLVPQPRDYFQRTPPVFQSSGLTERVSFAARANPLVTRDHPNFMRIERYFFTLLRNTNLTIQEILQNTFEPHEICLIEPVSHPPELVRLQKRNSLRYQQILETRFQGHAPTLQLKLALLYFGLPVAPMKPGMSQELVITDLDFLEDKLEISVDPLGFLDEYAERSYGDPNRHVPDRHFFKLPQMQEFTSLRIRPKPYDDDDFSSLRLRGGAAPAKMDWEQEGDGAAGPTTRAVRIFGYQGSVLVEYSPSSAYESFVEAADKLLGLVYKYNYSIRLQVWDQKSSDTEPVAEETGMIYQKNTKPGKADKISSLIKRLFSKGNADERYCGFVLFDKEEPPEFYQPSRDADRYIVRVWDAENQNMSYMKVPTDLSSNLKPNQFSKEYLRAMRFLLPRPCHQYLQFYEVGNASTYGLLDPPAGIWDQLIRDQANADHLPLLSFEGIDVPDDIVPVFIPGFHSYDADFSDPSREPPVTTLSSDDLELDGTNDTVGLSKLISAVNAANPLVMSDRKKIGFEVWLPGDDFLNTVNSGQFINLVDTEINEQTIFNWKAVVRAYQGPRVHAEPGKVGIVARPVFSNYKITAKNDAKRQFSVNLNDLELSEFREEVKSKLFPRYNPELKQIGLHLVQSTWSKNPIDFAIRADTNEYGWRWIVRHITEPDITVSVEYWPDDCAVEKDTTWGPRYDTVEPLSLTSEFDSMDKRFTSRGPPGQKLFEKSKNNLEGARRALRLRERLFWDDMSMFTNPTKPAMPLQGPPIETIIRTGPYVPAFTTAMRTPSEVARLEREVHSLRGNLLDRVRECPYMDCERIFRFQDKSELDRHLREDHTTLQCFLCDEEKYVLPFYDSQSIKQHFLDKHLDSVKREVLGSSGKGEKPFNHSFPPGPRNDIPAPRPRPKRETRVEPEPAKDVAKDVEKQPEAPQKLTPLTRYKQMGTPARWREATATDPLPPRRPRSPLWDEFLEPQSQPWDFYPDADWRCSRCFRAAGRSLNQIEMHMDQRGSCKIRRTLGTTRYGPVPNRSGWIIPDEKFDFKTAYYNFVNEYPAYRHTMFPARQESVESVWENPYNLDKATGSIEDDPNYKGAAYMEARGDKLPWPPYQGLVIPLNGPEPDSPGVYSLVSLTSEESDEEIKEEEEDEDEEVKEEDDEVEDVLEDEEIKSGKNGDAEKAPNSQHEARSEGSVLESTEDDSQGSSTSGYDEKDEEYDPNKQPADTADELEEEYSERSAVLDPIRDLETDESGGSKKRATPATADTPEPANKRTRLPAWKPLIVVPPIWEEMNRVVGHLQRGSQPPATNPPMSDVSDCRRSSSGPPSGRPQTRGK
ncbi:uncharacterized protein F4812DRAFT_255262 [Daldinia caldariorum]|uniref:uncharacterized protein n=1 Tax=Daldinia caldariorum TaxID=326644 RepID=UPI0020075E33|nr:uncharacterized protein F4812DRAFT_255262 [Daldinia caldariorum]KAI1463253.1 hypothetical protein F4812DRAFT_255262 [Daldinia caldariorum]